jgi:hypothetical protein
MVQPCCRRAVTQEHRQHWRHHSGLRHRAAVQQIPQSKLQAARAEPTIRRGPVTRSCVLPGGWDHQACVPHVLALTRALTPNKKKCCFCEHVKHPPPHAHARRRRRRRPLACEHGRGLCLPLLHTPVQVRRQAPSRAAAASAAAVPVGNGAQRHGGGGAQRTGAAAGAAAAVACISALRQRHYGGTGQR